MKTGEKIAIDYTIKEVLKKKIDECNNINELQKALLKILSEAAHEEDKRVIINNSNIKNKITTSE